MSEEKEVKEVVMKYTPYVAVDPNDYSEKQYLYDNNAILTEMNETLKFIAQLLVSEKENKEEKKKQINVIGSKNV